MASHRGALDPSAVSVRCETCAVEADVEARTKGQPSLGKFFLKNWAAWNVWVELTSFFGVWRTGVFGLGSGFDVEHGQITWSPEETLPMAFDTIPRKMVNMKTWSCDVRFVWNWIIDFEHVKINVVIWPTLGSSQSSSQQKFTNTWDVKTTKKTMAKVEHPWNIQKTYQVWVFSIFRQLTLLDFRASFDVLHAKIGVNTVWSKPLGQYRCHIQISEEFHDCLLYTWLLEWSNLVAT